MSISQKHKCGSVLSSIPPHCWIFGHCILYTNYDFATLSHTQELEWKKTRTWPCTGSGEIQKTKQNKTPPTPATGNCPLLEKGYHGMGGGKKPAVLFRRAVLSCPAVVERRSTM